jgi:colanic acid biosynthesis protein WcaH
MSLSEAQFLNIVEVTPLVAIDLVIRSEFDRILLGRRTNRPAQGFWFVPGGRIRKNERIREALRRIAQAEVGVPLEEAKLLGVYDHLYEDNFYGRPGINTHYVVLAHGVTLSEQTALHPDAQHEELRWWPLADLLASPHVHENTKVYFKG